MFTYVLLHCLIVWFTLGLFVICCSLEVLMLLSLGILINDFDFVCILFCVMFRLAWRGVLFCVYFSYALVVCRFRVYFGCYLCLLVNLLIDLGCVVYWLVFGYFGVYLRCFWFDFMLCFCYSLFWVVLLWLWLCCVSCDFYMLVACFDVCLCVVLRFVCFLGFG